MNTTLMLSRWGRRAAKELLRPKPKYKQQEQITKWNIVTGDLVRVIQGPNTGEQGKITAVIRKSLRVIIEGVNMRPRNEKPADGSPGKRVIKACSIHYSNVMLVDPSTGEPTKIVYKYLEDGTKVRVAKKSGHVIPHPKPFLNRAWSNVIGPKDTLPEDAFEVTFPRYNEFLKYIYPNDKDLLKSTEKK
eukprot:gene8034-10887_t